MESNGIVMSIVMDGRDGSKSAAFEYVAPDRDTYIQGREGSPFTIVVVNRSGRRVAVVPSVDGLSVMDGRKASDESGGYVLDPYGRVEIPGWKRAGGKVARFEFAGMKDGRDGSYVARIGGDVGEKGVIGLAVFEEKRRPPLPTKGGGVFRGGRLEAVMGSATLSASSALSASAATASSVTMRSSNHVDTSFSLEEPEQTLGTGYGAEADFRTVASDFVRGAFLTRLALFYDDERGLKRRGIDVRRPVRTKPDPFPGNSVGTQAPDGWDARG